MFSEGEIRSKMNKGWIRFKCSASVGAEKAGGRYDPETDVTLFTDETKEAFENCLQHSDHIRCIEQKRFVRRCGAIVAFQKSTNNMERKSGGRVDVRKSTSCSGTFC